MRERTDVEQGLRRTSRLLLFATAAVAATAVFSGGFLLLQNERESRLRSTLESYHLRSLSIESRIAEELAALEFAFGAVGPSAGEPNSPEEARSISRTVAAIRALLEEAAGLEEAFGKPDSGPAVDRALARFDRLEDTLTAVQRGEVAAREDLSAHLRLLSLAIEDLRRLHFTAVSRALAGLRRGAADRTKALVVFGSVAVIAVLLIAWRTLIMQRVVLLREKEIELALKGTHERLLHTQKIEALGTLAGGVAHDFNNLLTAIAVHADTLREGLGPESPLLGSAQAIERAAEEAESLTRQLLAFSRRDIHGSQVADLNQAVRRVETMLRRLIGEDINFVTRLDPEVGLVQADPAQIEQVILNLVVNARDAMPSGGSLSIETAPARIELEARDSGPEPTGEAYARLTVRDTGCGIDAEARDRIFEPFFTTKSPGEGTGLGLFMVYGIVSASRGFVSVESETGIGTRFDVYLRPSDGSKADEVQPRDVRPTGGSETILLVEDQRQVREVSARLLREAGYAVLEAEDGVEALQLCTRRTEPIDLILTDVVMPLMSGPELVERSKRLHPEARVLYMTGYAEDLVLSRGVSDSVMMLLPKPFRRPQLLEHVRGALDSGRAGS
jgi:signal transduction histidine kinase/CheY-like chemotaxis protein